MKVDVYSRQRVIELGPNEGACLISISTPVGESIASRRYSKQVPLDGWHAVLELQFHDVTSVVPTFPDLILFDEEMAKELLGFIKQHQGKPFVVHCDAGVSRSAAVGSFLRDFLQYEATFHETRDDKFRNILVYNLLRRAAYEEMEEGL